MAIKQVIIEVVEQPRGVPGATRRYPGNDHSTEEGWARCEEIVYEVTRLVNTVEFNIGDRLEKEEIQVLCQKGNYKIVVSKPKK